MKGTITYIAMILVLALLITGLIAIVICGKTDPALGTEVIHAWCYPLTTKVVALDRENDIVTCEDFNGFQWQFEGCEDWQEGDVCSMIMNSKGTAKIFDDEIITVQYGGYFEGWN